MKKLLALKQDFVYNATNTSLDMRQKMYNLFFEYGAEVNVIYIEKDLEIILKQNNKREEKVPDKVII